MPWSLPGFPAYPRARTILRRAVELPAQLAHVRHANASHGMSPTGARGHVRKCSLERSSVVTFCRISRAFGPHNPKQAYSEPTSSMITEPSSAHVAASTRIVLPNAVPVTIRKRSSARRVTVKSHSIPPASRSALRIDHCADRPGHPVIAERFRKPGGALARNLDLVERGLVEKGAGLATGGVRRRSRATSLPAQPSGEGSWPSVAFGLEPVRALPAELLAERRPQIAQRS